MRFAFIISAVSTFVLRARSLSQHIRNSNDLGNASKISHRRQRPMQGCLLFFALEHGAHEHKGSVRSRTTILGFVLNA